MQSRYWAHLFPSTSPIELQRGRPARVNQFKSQWKWLESFGSSCSLALLNKNRNSGGGLALTGRWLASRWTSDTPDTSAPQILGQYRRCRTRCEGRVETKSIYRCLTSSTREVYTTFSGIRSKHKNAHGSVKSDFNVCVVHTDVIMWWKKEPARIQIRIYWPETRPEK